MRPKRILITAGGTGGHLYPAQALAQQLMRSIPPNKVLSSEVLSSEVLFVAGGLKTNRFFDQSRFAFRSISCSPLNGLRGLAHLIQGFWQSVKIIKEFKPDVVVGFGSYYTIPVILAARYLQIPIVLHEANSIPGRANKWMAYFATAVGVHFPVTASFFAGKAYEVGLPLREGFSLDAVEKREALARYGLSGEHKTLLICGGSQGAEPINELMLGCFLVLQELSLQVIHLTGNPVSAEKFKALYQTQGIAAHVTVFEKEMQMAWRAADGFIGRSGAATIAESIEFEVPGILIPYPHATDQHQDKNADFLVETVGSAMKFSQSKLTPAALESAIELLFSKEKHNRYKQALELYKQRPHKQTLVEIVLGCIK